MRKLRRSVARAYAREFGIDHLNGARRAKNGAWLPSRFSVMWRRLLTQPDRKLEARRDKNQRAADKRAHERRAACYARMGMAPNG